MLVKLNSRLLRDQLNFAVIAITDTHVTLEPVGQNYQLLLEITKDVKELESVTGSTKIFLSEGTELGAGQTIKFNNEIATTDTIEGKVTKSKKPEGKPLGTKSTPAHDDRFNHDSL